MSHLRFAVVLLSCWVLVLGTSCGKGKSKDTGTDKGKQEKKSGKQGPDKKGPMAALKAAKPAVTPAQAKAAWAAFETSKGPDRSAKKKALIAMGKPAAMHVGVEVAKQMVFAIRGPAAKKLDANTAMQDAVNLLAAFGKDALPVMIRIHKAIESKKKVLFLSRACLKTLCKRITELGGKCS